MALTFGGLDGILNHDMIESGLARPYSGYHRSIVRKAAALTESMATNHGFIEGNKRTTLILLHLMLAKSGYRLAIGPGDASVESAIEGKIESVAKSEAHYEDLVVWFKPRIQRI